MLATCPLRQYLKNQSLLNIISSYGTFLLKREFLAEKLPCHRFLVNVIYSEVFLLQVPGCIKYKGAKIQLLDLPGKFRKCLMLNVNFLFRLSVFRLVVAVRDCSIQFS